MKILTNSPDSLLEKITTEKMMEQQVSPEIADDIIKNIFSHCVIKVTEA